MPSLHKLLSSITLCVCMVSTAQAGAIKAADYPGLSAVKKSLSFESSLNVPSSAGLNFTANNSKLPSGKLKKASTTDNKLGKNKGPKKGKSKSRGKHKPTPIIPAAHDNGSSLFTQGGTFTWNTGTPSGPPLSFGGFDYSASLISNPGLGFPITASVTTVPVPAALWLFMSGLLGLGAAGRLRRR